VVYGKYRDFRLVSEIISVNSTYSTLNPLNHFTQTSIKRGILACSIQLPVPRPTLFGDHEGPPTKVGADHLKGDLTSLFLGILK
jgi:hypothetical protein